MFDALPARSPTHQRTPLPLVAALAFHLVVLAGAGLPGLLRVEAVEPVEIRQEPSVLKVYLPAGNGGRDRSPLARPRPERVERQAPAPAARQPVATVAQAAPVEPTHADPGPPAPDAPVPAGAFTGTGDGFPGLPAGGTGAEDDPAPGAPGGPAGVPSPLRLGGRVLEPRLLHAPQPRYPTLARLRHVEGTVVVEAIIDEQGKVIEARVVSGPEALQEAARQAALGYRYAPATLGGSPVRVYFTLSVTFTLRR